MNKYAQIDNSGRVVAVIISSQEFIESDIVENSNRYIQTFSEIPNPRKNFAGIGFIYDSDRDAFISPQPFPSWLLVEETCQWRPPVDYPSDGKVYDWNEDALSWKIVVDESIPE